MSYLKMMQNAAKGAAAGVLLLTALPVFGAIGPLTAADVVTPTRTFTHRYGTAPA